SAVLDARDIAVAKSTTVAPVLSDGILRDDPAALARLDTEVRNKVLSPRTVRVKIWSEEGRILYSDDTPLVGQRFPLGSSERAGLALLLLVQIPVAWSMARRLQRGREQEKRLLHRAIEAGAVERRHIAADLHDGVVQALAGNAFSLAAAAGEAERAGMGEVART